MKKITALVVILACAACAVPSFGEDWVAAMTVAETTTNYKMVAKFAELLKEKTNGEYTLELYPSGQLGNDFVEAVVAGSITMGTGTTTDLISFVPEMGLFDLPNLFNDLKQMRAFLRSDYAKKTINTYCEAVGVHMLAFSDAGFRQLTTTSKKITSIDDLASMKIRVMTNPYHIMYWNAVGASATPIEFSELFMALQQNTIDGEENPYMNIVGNNLHEVQKYIVETNHIGHIITFFMNNDTYQSLPEETRKIVDQCAEEAAKFAEGVAEESIELDKATCLKAGCEILTIGEADYAKLREKAQVVYDAVRKNLGSEKVDGLLNAIAALKD